MIRRSGLNRRLEHPVRDQPDERPDVVIEMNPRVSRSSALASKATGFPIAKIAAKLALGYHLDEFRTTSRADARVFEPTSTTSSSKSRGGLSRSSRSADRTLTTQMKSVGEAMAIGRTSRKRSEGDPLAGAARQPAARISAAASTPPRMPTRTTARCRSAGGSERSADVGDLPRARRGWTIEKLHDGGRRSTVVPRVPAARGADGAGGDGGLPAALQGIDGS